MWFLFAHKVRCNGRTRFRTSSFRPRVEALEDRCLPSGGLLDPTFGTAGIVTTNVGANNTSAALSVATYPSTGSVNDGKVVAAGFAVGSLKGKTAYDDLAVVRYNVNGLLDATIGGGSGQVLTDLGNAIQRAEDVAVQPDGKIVVAGYSGNQFALLRYNANGSLDTSFGGTAGGKIVGHFGTQSSDAAFRIGLQADGKIVVAGTTTPKNTSNVDLALERYNADGSVDTSFGSGGKVIEPFGYPLSSLASGQGFDLAIDPSTGPLDPNACKIVVVSQLQGGPVVVVRFTTTGSLDPSFAAGAGYAALSSLNTSPAVAVQSDDRIVVSGDASVSGGSAIGLARFSVDGTPDTTFGSGGLVITPLANVGKVDSLTIQPDGKIVVAGGQVNPAGNSDAGNFLLARYNPADGSLDTSFGKQGIAVSSGDPVYVSYQVDVALEPDGRIVEAGSTYTSAGFSFTLARFLSTGPQIGSFTASSNPASVGSSVTLTASNVVKLNPGSTVTQVAFYADSNGDGVLDSGDALLGFGSQSNTGTWTFTFSTAGWASGSYTLFAQAEDSYSAFSDPLALTLLLQ
jgi:uncharacterized delta-60 repeat protein